VDVVVQDNMGRTGVGIEAFVFQGRLVDAVSSSATLRAGMLLLPALVLLFV
jgi:hypothetical protein